MAGPFAPTANAALAVAEAWGVAPADVLRAAIAAASDSTPGDIALAAVVYVIARQSGSSVAGDVLAGRIKVDEVPRSALSGDEWAYYRPAASGGKGDTIAVPSDLDVTNLAHRGAVVHELTHAEDDKAARGPRVRKTARDMGEVRAYRRQARFLLDTVGALSATGSGAAVQAIAEHQIASIWNPLILVALVIEALGDADRLKPVVVRINAAAPRARAEKSVIDELFTWGATRLEVRLQTLIRKPKEEGGYGISSPEDNRTIQEGLSGESILDWINRPIEE